MLEAISGFYPQDHILHQNWNFVMEINYIFGMSELQMIKKKNKISKIWFFGEKNKCGAVISFVK